MLGKRQSGRAAFLLVVLCVLCASAVNDVHAALRDPAVSPCVVLVLQEGAEAEAVFGAVSPLRALEGQMAVGLMNTAVGGPPRAASAFLTVGAGTRLASGADQAAGAYLRDETLVEGPAGEVYGRRVGPLPPEAWLVVPGLALLRRQAAEDVRSVGALGEAVRRGGAGAGRDRSGPALLILGRPPPDQRLGALVAMDAGGVVSRGAFVPDEESLTAAVLRFLGAASLVVIQLPPDAAFARVLTTLIDRLDARRDTLLALAPAPLPGDGPWDRLTPVAAWGRSVRPGALVSATTHTPGLVANTDVAPTIARWLDLETGASTFGGQVMRSEPGPGPDALLRFSHRVTLHRHLLLPVLGGAGVFAVLSLALIVFALLRPASARLLAAARGALLAVAALPLALFLVPFAHPSTGWAYAAATAALVVACALAAQRIAGRSRSPLLVLFLLTDACLIVDLASGARGIAASLLSDFPLAGFRFYGIGNEYMAVLVGTLTVALPWAAEATGGQGARLPVALAFLFWLILVGLIGHPAVGANFGGTLTAVATFGIAGALWAGQGSERAPARRARVLLWLLIALAVCAAGLFLIDAARPPSVRTHVGQLAAVMAERSPSEGLAVAWRLARRKLGMNLRLLTSGIFLAVLAAVAPALALWYHNTGPGLRALLAGRPSLRAGVLGALWGAVVGLIAKDSGVVVWGLMTAAALAVLLDLMLEVRSGEITLSAQDRAEPVDADHGAGCRRQDSRRGDQR